MSITSPSPLRPARPIRRLLLLCAIFALGSFVLSATPGPGGQARAASRFAPSFTAGTTDDRAGAFSPETVTIGRTDEGGELGSIDVQNPPGLLAALSGVGICPGTRAEDSDCPADSEIGTVNIGLGAGLLTFYAEGGVYLTGPYMGAPIGLAVFVPISGGLIDLGEVNVRAKLQIDPTTAALSIETDPLPHSVDGIPLRIRTIHLALDRKEFIFNPTGCAPHYITATITDTEGGSATGQSPFRASGCGHLPFKPTLALKLAGGLGRGGHPRVRAVLKTPRRGADLKRATITLPATELVDSAHIRGVCTRIQFAAGACPADSIYGHAGALSPLLGEPLGGPVYLRSAARGLPDLVVALHGPASRPIEIDLDGRIGPGRQGGTRISFATLPDVPLTRFSLTMDGARKSLLENSADLCATEPRALVRLTAHNAKGVALSSPLLVSCGGRSSTPHLVSGSPR